RDRRAVDRRHLAFRKVRVSCVMRHPDVLRAVVTVHRRASDRLDRRDAGQDSSVDFRDIRSSLPSATQASMRSNSFLPLLLCAAPAAQDVLYYKFEENGGTNVVNFASASGIAPIEGTLIGGLQQRFAPGRFGIAALSGGINTSAANTTLVDTGWIPSWSNASLSFAFFMKERAVPTSTSYFFYHGPSGFRLFTGGVATRGLLLRNSPEDTPLTTDVQTLAATNWLHVGLVIDAAALTATWYLDGVPQPPIPISGGSNVAANT